MCEHATESGWVSALFVICAAMTGGAVLRAGMRCFVGWGAGPEPGAGTGAETKGEEEPDAVLGRTPTSMYTTVVVLVLGSLAVGVLPGTAEAAHAAGRRFVDTAGYAAAILGHAAHGAQPGPVTGWSASGISLAVLGVLAAAGVAIVFLRRPGHNSRVGHLAAAGVRPAIAALRAAHSGHIGDYVAWMYVGLALLGGVLTLQL
jgi:multicomponent Na+:H+ antiporter subunit D